MNVNQLQKSKLNNSFNPNQPTPIKNVQTGTAVLKPNNINTIMNPQSARTE